MKPPAQFWLDLLPSCEDLSKAAGRRRRQCLRVLYALNVRHPDLYHGKQRATLSEESAAYLVAILKFTDKPTGHDYKHRISYLVRGLEKGVTDLDWDAFIPSIPVVITRDRPRLMHEDFQSLPIFYDIERAFLANLTNEPPETPTARVGQLLISAILYGGLSQRCWLQPWIDALSAPHSLASTLWFDMLYTSKHQAREKKECQENKDATNRESESTIDWEIQRRWFADPLTFVLILRWFEKFPADCKVKHLSSPFIAIKHYLERILPPKVSVTDSLVKDLFTGATTRLGLEIPPFLMAYAEGRIKSVSLPPSVWERLLTGRRIIGNTRLNSINEPLPKTEFISLRPSGNLVHPVNQEKMLSRILSDILPKDSIRKLQAPKVKIELSAFYEERKERMNQALACLILWCIDMVTPYKRQDLLSRRVVNVLKPSSVRTYLDRIGKRFIAVAGALDIVDLEGDELHDLYSDVIKLCPTKSAQHDTGGTLVAFHEFLQVRFGAQSVDFSDISVSAGPVETGVNSNLLSPAEFDLVKKALAPRINKANRLRQIQVLIAILCFRCGLRENEARKLLLIDVHGQTEPELLVRNNQYAYVKSGEAIRRLPLGCLLEPDELKLLLEWRQFREGESTVPNKDALLFCNKSTETTRLSEYELFTPIVQAMRQVTGDDTLTLHHLRHSFASWLILRLLKDFPPEMCRRYHFLNHDCFLSDRIHELRTTILGNYRMGRKALYAVALLCGHSSPQVTLLHYMHLCDWLLSQELSLPDNQPALDVKTIAHLTGLPEHVVYHARKKSGGKSFHLSTIICKLKVPTAFLSKSTSQSLDSSLIPEKERTVDVPLWIRVEATLRERYKGVVLYSDLARRNGLSVRDVHYWCKNAERLSAMKTKSGKPRHLIGITSGNKADFLFQVPLRFKADKEMVSSVLNIFEYSRGHKRNALCKGVSMFIRSFYTSGNGVPFEHNSDVRKYLSFLKLLCIPQQQIRVIRILPRISQKSKVVEQEALAKRFELPPECIVFRDPRAREYSRTGELRIQVMSETVGPDVCKDRIKVSLGFRYAMYMISIIYGLK